MVEQTNLLKAINQNSAEIRQLIILVHKQTDIIKELIRESHRQIESLEGEITLVKSLTKDAKEKYFVEGPI